jgi:voltage-gated potassium channel
MAVVTVWVAILVPMEAADLHPIHLGVLIGLRIFYFIDILFNFNLVYRLDGNDFGAGEINLEEDWHVTDRNKIARRYLKRSGFIFDVIAALPVDLVVIFYFPALKQKRVLWAFIKLLSFTKLPSLQQRATANDTAISFAITYINSRWDGRKVNMITHLAYFLVIAHWAACMWSFSADDSAEWYDNYIGGKHYEADPPPKYVVAIYWSIMTITSIGYGDVLPHTKHEVMWCVVLMTLGSFFWAYIIGHTITLINTFNDDGSEDGHELNMFNMLIKRTERERQRAIRKAGPGKLADPRVASVVRRVGSQGSQCSQHSRSTQCLA